MGAGGEGGSDLERKAAVRSSPPSRTRIRRAGLCVAEVINIKRGNKYKKKRVGYNKSKFPIGRPGYMGQGGGGIPKSPKEILLTPHAQFW